MPTLRTDAPIALPPVDGPGDDLSHLSHPQAIAARDSRAVVYDSGNQRLMKLSLGP